LDLPKSSVHGIAATLDRCGYLRRSQSGKYLFGLKLLHLANSALSNLEIRQVAAPLLRKLAQETNLTVNMAVLEANEAVFIEKITPPSRVGPPTWIGKHMDVNCTAVGKVLLANLSDEEIDRFIERYGLTKHNENASVTPSRFKRELSTVRVLGYAFNDEESEIGYRAIAVPVQNLDSHGGAAVSLAGRTSQINSENFNDLVRKLKIVAQLITQGLEWQLPKIAYTSTTALEDGNEQSACSVSGRNSC
jgi:DNA-binding IclR family transcriptional regulator